MLLLLLPPSISHRRSAAAASLGRKSSNSSLSAIIGSKTWLKEPPKHSQLPSPQVQEHHRAKGQHPKFSYSQILLIVVPLAYLRRAATNGFRTRDHWIGIQRSRPLIHSGSLKIKIYQIFLLIQTIFGLHFLLIL